jgi:2-polyprenyl-6-methoxyphenol hydroxylase-like FAD-dependent oxidoreductase
MVARSAIVVGGGIGGLAAGIALHSRGWQVRVLERSPEFGEVGAGISLWSNALRALDVISAGLADDVRERGDIELQGGIQARNGRILSRVDVDEMIRRYGPVFMVHRADLLQILLDRLPPSALVSGIEVKRVDEDGTVTHDAGEERVDLVVGADGVNSTVRRLWPGAKPPRYAGYTAWRWVTPAAPTGVGGETWGLGTRFGRAPLPDGRMYCYATANTPEGDSAVRGELAELRARFSDWHDPIPALVEAASDSEILRHDLYELPDLPSFTRGKVVLLGDAAHAMTPNLGQGACQALEDAAVLAATPSDLIRYDQERRPRTQRIVKLSRQMGAMGQWSWRPAVAVRDRLLPMVPTSATLRVLDPVLAWPDSR